MLSVNLLNSVRAVDTLLWLYWYCDLLSPWASSNVSLVHYYYGLVSERSLDRLNTGGANNYTLISDRYIPWNICFRRFEIAFRIRLMVLSTRFNNLDTDWSFFMFIHLIVWLFMVPLLLDGQSSCRLGFWLFLLSRWRSESLALSSNSDIWNLVTDIRNLKSEVWNLKLKSEIWDLGFEIWDLKFEIWDLSSNFRVRSLRSQSILIWLSKYSYNPLLNSNSSF